MKHVLEADSIILRFGERTILSDVYIKSETGKITALVGNNGSGKSSLMKVMLGAIKATTSSFRVDGRHVAQPYREKGLLNYLPQQNFLPSTYTVAKVFWHYQVSLDAFQKSFDVPLNNDDFVADLHGSTKRLVELFILIKYPTKFTLLDEPFTHLSPILMEQLQELLKKEKEYKGFILTDHNFHSVKHIADDLYFLHQGYLKHRRDIADIETYISLFEL